MITDRSIGLLSVVFIANIVNYLFALFVDTCILRCRLSLGFVGLGLVYLWGICSNVLTMLSIFTCRVAVILCIHVLLDIGMHEELFAKSCCLYMLKELDNNNTK